MPFTLVERDAVRDELIAAARADARVTAAAVFGSDARGETDEWSDIDMGLCLAEDADRAAVLTDCTTRLYDDNGAIAHYDVCAAGAVYRVFLLQSTLQVDLSVWDAAAFGALGPSFRLVFGTARELPQPEPPGPEGVIGGAWLYALHVRSSLARGRVWQAEHMLSRLREQIISLACTRHGLPSGQGRGVDRLPAEAHAQLRPMIAGSLAPDALGTAFAAATEVLLQEASYVAPELASRLREPLRELAVQVGTPARAGRNTPLAPARDTEP
ncbi:MAG: nucleotidyltransferase domain-containing protein [Mycobacteriales bacterium]